MTLPVHTLGQETKDIRCVRGDCLHVAPLLHTNELHLQQELQMRSLQVNLSGLCLERCPLTSASSVSSLQRPLLRTANLPPSPPLSPVTSSSALFPPSLLSVNLHGGSSRHDKSSRRALRENRPQRAKIRGRPSRNSARQRNTTTDTVDSRTCSRPLQSNITHSYVTENRGTRSDQKRHCVLSRIQLVLKSSRQVGPPTNRQNR